jgi:hypothetical protein
MIVGAAFLGTVWGVAASLGGHPVAGISSGLFIVGFSVVVSRGRGEGWVLLREAGDERQSQIAKESAEITLSLTAYVAVAGALWELAHGYFGKFGLMCSVIGAIAIVVPQVLRRRR